MGLTPSKDIPSRGMGHIPGAQVRVAAFAGWLVAVLGWGLMKKIRPEGRAMRPQQCQKKWAFVGEEGTVNSLFEYSSSLNFEFLN